MWRVARRVGLLLAALGIVAAILVLPPPPSLLRRIALSSSGWLMAANDENAGRMTAASHKVIRTYVHLALAAYLEGRTQPNEENEAEVLARMMMLVRRSVLTAGEFAHDPYATPALVSGFGYCDQVNGSVGAVAARRFPRAQIFALYDDAQRTSPHTIGRVWSKERRDWLYFDAFFEPRVIFTKDAQGRPNFIAVAGGTGVPAVNARSLYGMPGFVLAEYGSTFASHLIRKATFRTTPVPVAITVPARTTVPAGTTLPVGTPVPGGAPPQPVLAAHVPSTLRNEGAFRRVARAYMTARLDDVLGRPRALAEYRAVAADATAASDSRAAEIARAAAHLAQMEETAAEPLDTMVSRNE